MKNKYAICKMRVKFELYCFDYSRERELIRQYWITLICRFPFTNISTIVKFLRNIIFVLRFFIEF